MFCLNAYADCAQGSQQAGMQFAYIKMLDSFLVSAQVIHTCFNQTVYVCRPISPCANRKKKYINPSLLLDY